MPLACSALEANWNLTPTSIFTVRIRISMCRCWKEGEGKKRPAGKILQMRLTAAGRLPVSRCREQQSETEKNKSKQISALVSVSGVEWRLLAALKGASGSRQGLADVFQRTLRTSRCILPHVWFAFTMRHEVQWKNIFAPNSAQSDKPKLDFWETANRLKSFCTKRFKGAYLNQWPSQLMDKIK